MWKRLSGIIKHYYTINKILLFIVTLIILVSLFPREGKFRFEFQKGKPWTYDDLITSFDFAVLKPDNQVKREKEDIVNNAYLYFYNNHAVEVNKKTEFRNLFAKLVPVKLGDASQATYNQYLAVSNRLMDTLFSRGILEFVHELENKQPDYKIAVTDSIGTRIRELASFFTLQTAAAYIKDQLKTTDVRFAAFIEPVFLECLAQNIVYQPDLTEKQRNILVGNISFTRGMVQKGEKIIAQGELVNDEKFQVLESYRLEYESNLSSMRNFRMIIVGRILLVALSLLVFALFMFTFRRDIFNENRNIILLLLLITSMVVITTYVLKSNVVWVYSVPLCLVPIIVRTFFDTRLALFVHIITIGILGFLVPNSFEFLFMQLITGIITIISIVRLNRRSQFFLTSLFIFISYSIIYIGMILIQEGRLSDLIRLNFILFGISALLTLFAYPLIYLFERLFGLVTDISLIELSDMHSPLMRELSLKAPGTFQHSLMVSNIAEEAALAIGANALLARTGALYHDIGKMDMPQYFIENQSGRTNPHNEIPYEESARIIINHVIMGVEKARQYQLPELVTDFIRTHHGTKLTAYFFEKYRQDNPDEEIDVARFRYKGPLPYSKETSILMMADSVEAASRSLVMPDEDQLQDLVDTIIEKQMNDGQFYNSDLTLKEITRIKKIIKHKMMSINHIRIEYPTRRVEIK